MNTKNNPTSANLASLLASAKQSAISDITLAPCVDSPYIKPQRMHYVENGFKKTWDFIQSHDSVAIILHNVDNDSFIVVRQFRPAVFIREQERKEKSKENQISQNQAPQENTDEKSVGYVYELCAGLVDKEGKSIEQIAAEEVLEECGYKVDSSALVEVATFRTSVGSSGAQQYLFYARVGQKDKVCAGGGIDGEVIECFEIARGDLEAFLQDSRFVKTPGLGFGILWFLQHTKQIKFII
ncbi:NUDIX domain-containing protein [Helicobacter sp. MIT 00-7814]|uniref:NUDIX hydrolase n=1 Tax=unclassified Helicobacter TaxID=2593540 RepID=UPI000E1E562A|nr:MULTISPECIES: NUDIX hydrolase [unclassified Helicobacter]RDU54801.1 NUDIX domain-containing protein [Helicobacter sp. MIT 99-10781]RDU54859.1 NUDIX domain-containing protein [Helicobacter sp. MIT 00-7814]